METKFKIGPVVIALVTTQSSFTRIPPSRYDLFEYTGEEPPTLTLRVHEESAFQARPKRLIAELENNWRLYELQDRNFYELEILEQTAFQVKAVARINKAWDEIDFYKIPLTQLSEDLKPHWNTGAVFEPLVQWWLTAWAAMNKKGLLIHGCAIAWQGQGFAFIGASGAGKSTIGGIFLKETDAELLNDERIFVWRDERNWYVSGTPWPGMLDKASPGTAPLARIFSLKKGPTNQIKSLSPLSLTTDLFPQFFLPIWNLEKMEGITTLADSLFEEVPCAELEFLKDPSVVHYLGEVLQLSPRCVATESK